MKILWLKLGGFWPATSGGRLRSFHMLSELAARHEVTVVTTHAPGEDPDAQEEKLAGCQQVISIPYTAPKVKSPAFPYVLLKSWLSPLPVDLYKYRSETIRSVLTDLLRQQDYQLCIADFLTAMPNLPESLSTPLLFFSHNVEHMIWQRIYENESNPLKSFLLKIESRKMRKYEFQACERADFTVCVSDNDRDLLRKSVPDAVIESVATGVDTDFYTPNEEAQHDYSMVFSGSMDWYPNEDGILYFLEEVLPRVRDKQPEASLLIVGRNPGGKLKEAARLAKVDLTGTVDDIRPHVARGAVYIVPLRIGGGTRLKIFEALAMGKAIVSTTLGAEGLPLEPGTHYLQADKAEAMAAAVNTLLEHPEQGRALGRAGRELVEQKYSWPRIGRQFDSLCSQAVKLEQPKHTARSAEPLSNPSGAG